MQPLRIGRFAYAAYGSYRLAFCHDLRLCFALLTGYDEMKSYVFHHVF
jgi:hypothetical protein